MEFLRGFWVGVGAGREGHIDGESEWKQMPLCERYHGHATDAERDAYPAKDEK